MPTSAASWRKLLASWLLLSSACTVDSSSRRLQDRVNLSIDGLPQSSGTCGSKNGPEKAIDGDTETFTKNCNDLGNFWSLDLTTKFPPATIEEICIYPVYKKKGTKVQKLNKSLLTVQGSGDDGASLSWETTIPQHGLDDTKLCFDVTGIDGSIATTIKLQRQSTGGTNTRGLQIAEVEVWGRYKHLPEPTSPPSSQMTETLPPTQDTREVVNVALDGVVTSSTLGENSAEANAAIDGKTDESAPLVIVSSNSLNEQNFWKVELPDSVDFVTEKVCVYVPESFRSIMGSATLYLAGYVDSESDDEMSLTFDSLVIGRDGAFCSLFLPVGESEGLYDLRTVTVRRDQGLDPLYITEVQVLAKERVCSPEQINEIELREISFDEGMPSEEFHRDDTCGAQNITLPTFNATDRKNLRLSMERPDDNRDEQNFSDPCSGPLTDPNAEVIGDSDDPPRDQELEEIEQENQVNKGQRNMLRVGPSAREFSFYINMDSESHDKDIHGRKLAPVATIYKVRKCNNWLCWSTSHSLPEFVFWDIYKVKKGNQKDTYIGKLREPPRQNVKRLVLLIAGQSGHGPFINGGVGDWISGAESYWNRGWSKSSGSKSKNLRSSSWASTFHNYFNGGDTFVGTVFHAAFNWGESASEKRDIEDAFYNWLLSKTFASNLEEVIIAGHSRGGCLALRLGERFNRNFGASVDVAIAPADPVCATGQSEFGASSSKRTNPIVPDWKANSANMASQFRNEGRSLYVENHVSGHKNFVLKNIVGLSDHRPNPQPTSFQISGWYNQHWIENSHTGADDWVTFRPNRGPINFWNRARNWFNGGCANPCPHGGMYDSVHCFVGKPPVGTTPFIWGGNYYYTPRIGPNICPMTGSWFDGANCYVGDAPDHLSPFIWSGNWYYYPDWSEQDSCDDYWTQWYDRDNQSGTGDWESLSLHSPTPCGGNTPVDIQCQTTFGASAWLTGEVLTCSKTVGLICKDVDQPDLNCNFDYKVRYLCPE